MQCLNNFSIVEIINGHHLPWQDKSHVQLCRIIDESFGNEHYHMDHRNQMFFEEKIQLTMKNPTIYSVNFTKPSQYPTIRICRSRSTSDG